MIETYFVSPLVYFIVAITIIIIKLLKGIFVNSEEGTPEYKKQIRFFPAISMLIGFLFSIWLFWPISFESFLASLLIGASTCGFYDIGKKTVLGK